MGTVRIGGIVKGSPSTQFWLEADWVAQSGNSSLLRVWLRAANGPAGTGGSNYGGFGKQTAHADGYLGEHNGQPFLPSGYGQNAQRWHDSWDRWFGHDANGNRGGVGLAMELVYGNINETHYGNIGAPPNIPPPVTIFPPQAPTVDNVVNITHNSFGVNYHTNGNGGAGIDAHEVEWWLNGGAQRVWVDTNARGYSDPQGGATPGAPVLTPGQAYAVRARVHNQAGWSGWSDWIGGTPYNTSRIKLDGQWRDAIPWIKVDGVWRRSRVFVKQDGTWRLTR
jgi:hypothetical protein